MSSSQFFDARSDQSQVKATIVSKYFGAWAKIMMAQVKGRGNKIAYIDLFSGPGVYKDGSKSTPLLILEQAVRDEKLRQALVTIFNDFDQDNAAFLKSEIHQIEGIDLLRYRPQIFNVSVNTEITEMFERIKLVPTLFFVDPWGYKGLSLRLIGSVLKNWGSDCIFFFNYNRINAGIANPIVQEHMNDLFGAERANILRKRLLGLNPYQRELTVVEEIAEALKDVGGPYVLPFGFKNEQGTRTTHHLIFVSKHVLGYTIMKDIMAGESSKFVQGVASFEYSPADERQPVLFELTRPLDDLANMLLKEFAGRRISFEELYRQHQVGRPYVKKNYKEIVLKLETEGKIVPDIFASQQALERGKAGVEDTIYTFPKVD